MGIIIIILLVISCDVQITIVSSVSNGITLVIPSGSNISNPYVVYAVCMNKYIFLLKQSFELDIMNAHV